MKTLIRIIITTGFILTTLSAMELPALFTDNMVLQQSTNVKIWGKASPGKMITIESSWGEKATAVTADDGHWKTDIKTPAAGGPYSLSISDKDTVIKINDLLIGEVWFCSGQSNMEMPVQGWPPNDLIDNYQQEIEQAKYPEIRMFTVARNAALFNQDDVIGNWRKCDPQSVKSFSATAYFFGKKLYKDLQVPIGLIHSSWGGTPAQAWMDEEHLQKYPEYKAVIDQIDGSLEKITEQKAWLDNLQQLILGPADNVNRFEELDFMDNAVKEAAFDDHGWQTMSLPRLWEDSQIGAFDGVVWFRREVDLSSFNQDQDLILELGPIDDMDITYVNGVEVGRHMKEGFWSVKRKYTIPANVIKKGSNIIAVKVVDNQGGGGIYGSADDMKIYPSENPGKILSLAGEWKFLPVAEYKNASFYLFDIADKQYYKRPKVPVESNPDTPTTLYKGMVHPVVPYTIKGTIWYQGEANVNNPKQYEELFPDLIGNWRDVWGLGDFPFYFVQIAPYDYGDGQSWKLRDAQRKTLRVPNTGMAVTLDIGNPKNIHPGNKQDVGKRLALWALAKTYAKNLVFSGPLYESIDIKGDKALIHFKYSAKGLKAKEGGLKDFLIAAKDKVFKKAKAVIEGDKVIVSSPHVAEPVAVRYLWDNTSQATLFNVAGLPASSFRTDNW